MILINNKIKQFIKGNWGKPKGLEKGLKLRDLDLERQHIPGKKKKRKKGRQKQVYKGHCCPFCHRELPLDEDRITKAKKECEGKPYTIWERMYRATTCLKCKAFEIKECPACKRKTWYRQGWHKHQSPGCGFEGKKLDLTLKGEV